MDLATPPSDQCSDMERLNVDGLNEEGVDAEALRRVLEMIPVGVVVVDREGNCVFHNRSAREILGATSAEALGAAEWMSDAGWWLADKSRTLSREELPMARALRGEAVRDELYFVSAGAGPGPEGRWIRASASEIRDADGFIASSVLLMRDVTEEQCERRTSGLFSQVVDRIADAVMLTDRDGVIEYVNPAFEASTGFSAEEVRGLTPRILKSGMQDPGFYENLWSELREGRSFQAVLSNRRKNGEIYQVDQTIAHLTDDDGNTSHFVAVIRDTTEVLRRQEEEVQLRLARQIQKKFYRAAPQVAGFDVAGAAHAAYQTSGDYFDFVPLPDNRMCIAVGDVEGHGLGSALVMALTRAYVHSFAALGMEPDQILTQVNRMLLDDLGDGGCFVTLLLVVLDLSSRSLVYAGAGHIPGYVLGVDGSTEYTLESTAPPLGLFSNVPFSSSSAINLMPGQLLALLTDGITEAAAPDGVEWGASGVLGYLAANRERPAAELVHGLCAEAMRFAGHHPHKDDMTSVVVKVD